MDFLDLDIPTSASDAVPIQPALSLPLGMELLLKKFHLGRFISDIAITDDVAQPPPTVPTTTEDTVSAEYAQLSLESIKSAPSPVPDTGDTPKYSLTTRLSRVLNLQVPDHLIREVFRDVDSELMASSTRIKGAIARRKFRSKVEQDAIRSQSQVLREYTPIVRQLTKLKQLVDELNQLHTSVDTICHRHRERASAQFSKQIGELSRDKKMVAVKRQLLANFRAKFTLNDYEEYVLTQGDVAAPELLDVYKKAQGIVDSCSLLLAMDNPQLGQAIMTKTTGILNQATARVVAFAHKTLDNYQYSSPERIDQLHRCLTQFRHQAVVWDQIVEGFVAARQKTVVDEFFAQAQGTDDARVAGRPIYLSAHDPIRYIGDLLAYIHAVVVGEHELVFSMFGGVAKGDFSGPTDDRGLELVVDNILEPLGRPVVAKIGGVLLLEIQLLVLNKIFLLVDLYKVMLGKVAPPELSMVKAMGELVSQTQAKLVLVVRNRLATIRNSSAAKLELSADLQPPEWIIEYYNDILPIMDSLATATIWNLDQSEHQAILELVVDQPIDICFTHVAELRKVPSILDQTILKANLLDLVMAKTMPIIMLSDLVVKVADIHQQLVDKLIDLEFNEFLQNLGLFDYYNVMCMIFDVNDDDFDVAYYQPITENQLFTREGIETANGHLQQYLPGALVDLQGKLTRLNLPMSVADVLAQTSTRFVNFYHKFSPVVATYLDTSLAWSDVDVATMLGVDYGATTRVIG